MDVNWLGDGHWPSPSSQFKSGVKFCGDVCFQRDGKMRVYKSEGHQRPLSILLVEDDDVDAEGVKRAFSKNQISNELFRACDGLEALDMIRGENGHTPIPKPFLMLVDINMPRMNGFDLIEVIRKDPALRRTVVFVLTTSQNADDKVRAFDHHIAGYLVKTNLRDGFKGLVAMLEKFWSAIELPPQTAA